MGWKRNETGKSLMSGLCLCLDPMQTLLIGRGQKGLLKLPHYRCSMTWQNLMEHCSLTSRPHYGRGSDFIGSMPRVCTSVHACMVLCSPVQIFPQTLSPYPLMKGLALNSSLGNKTMSFRVCRCWRSTCLSCLSLNSGMHSPRTVFL